MRSPASGSGADPDAPADGVPLAEPDGSAVPEAVSVGVSLGLAVSDADALGSGVPPPVASADAPWLIVTSVATGLDAETSVSGAMPVLTTTIRSRASEPRSYTPPAGYSSAASRIAIGPTCAIWPSTVGFCCAVWAI